MEGAEQQILDLLSLHRDVCHKITSISLFLSASSGKLTGLFSPLRNGDENFIKNHSGKERMTVPRVFQKPSSDSNSLSFAFTLPVQRKVLPLNSNASKKQLHPPLATSQELQNVKKIGKANAFNKLLNGQLRGKEMRVNTTHNYDVKTLNLVGAPLNRSKKINDGMSISRSGTSAFNPSARPGLRWKGKPRPNDKFTNKVMSPMEQFQTQSALSAKMPLDEEIIVMGEPLIFTKGNKKVSYALKPTAQKGNVSSHITGADTSNVNVHYNTSGTHFYNPASPVELQAEGMRIQGAQLTNQSPDYVHFHNNITISSVSEAQFPEGPKFNLSNTYNNPPWGVKNNGSNQQPNQLPTQPSNINQAGNQEEGEHGYEIEGHGLHNNESVYPSNFDQESLKEGAFGHQPRISGQNQTELVYYENDNVSIGDQGFGGSTNSTDFQHNSTINERYENQENKAVNTDELAEDQENSTAMQEESYGPQEKEMDNTQRINDNTSNLEQNLESKDDEQFAEGNPITPLSNRRYVPVDEFGSPLYGAETGNRVLHSLTELN